MPDGSSTAVVSLLDEVLAGLSQQQKTLPAKLFYDQPGCRLFEQITQLPEYYPTRTERGLLEQVAPILPKQPGCALVEFGGSEESKALPLIVALGATTYVPIDIASQALEALQQRLRQSHPALSVRPIAADFLGSLALPDGLEGQPLFGFFPGSTIGNLHPPEAHQFLVRIAHLLGHHADFLVGVDLRKDPAILVPAYDDSQGVTAAFNLNMLAHLNQALGTDFDLSGFAHRAIWNEGMSRIEMHLVSLRSQAVIVGRSTIAFKEGETIHTENSYKYSVDDFVTLAEGAEWRSRAVWTDPAQLFSLHLLTTTGAAG